VLKANGFTIGSLGKLIRAGLATATPGVVKAGGRTLGETGDHREGADNDRPMKGLDRTAEVIRRLVQGHLGVGPY
jgi:hypothetical protein